MLAWEDGNDIQDLLCFVLRCFAISVTKSVVDFFERTRQKELKHIGI